MKTPKIVLTQIDKAANTNRKLGVIKTTQPVTLAYRNVVDATSENVALNIVWKKRYYIYDRSSYFPLNVTDFTSYYGKIYRTEIEAVNGNLIDYLINSHVNAHYSAKVYVKNAVSIVLGFSLTVGSLCIYINETEHFRSGDDTPFFSGNQTINLDTGWNTIDIFIYHSGSNGIFSITGDLGSKVSAWERVDFEPPDAPTWADDTPTQVRYVDIEKSPQLVADFKWVNPKYNAKFQQVRGWGLYRKEAECPIDSDGNAIRAVSGWGTAFNTDNYNAVALSGDKRGYFLYNNYVWCQKAAYATQDIQYGKYNATCTVSGTEYIESIDQTILYAKNSSALQALGFGFYDTSNCGSSSRVGTYIYNHLKDFEWTSSSTYFVSGTDLTGIPNSNGYNYVLNCYDDSINNNRSEFSEELFMDWKPPTAPSVSSDNIIFTTGQFKKLITWITNPSSWGENGSAVRGVRVWDVTSPRSDPPVSQHLIADIPINVSGTNTRIEVNKYISAGLYQDLLDYTTYTFYLSSYDWYGNEILTGLPSFSARTRVSVKTSQSSNRVEMDSDTGTLKVYADI